MSDSGADNLLGECSKQDDATDPSKATLSPLYALFIVYAPICIHFRFLALRVVCENSALIVTAKFSSLNGWKSVDAHVFLRTPTMTCDFTSFEWTSAYRSIDFVQKPQQVRFGGRGTHTLFSHIFQIHYFQLKWPHFLNIYLLFFWQRSAEYPKHPSFSHPSSVSRSRWQKAQQDSFRRKQFSVLSIIDA